MKKLTALFLAILIAMLLIAPSLADEAEDTLFGMIEELIEPSKSIRKRSEYLPKLYWAYMLCVSYRGLSNASTLARELMGEELAIGTEKSYLEIPTLITNSYKGYLNGENDGRDVVTAIEMYCQAYRETHSK